MKKTLVTLAVATVAVTATTAQAATVYEKDGTKVDVSGSVRLNLGKFTKDERADLRNDGSRVRIDASQDLGKGLNGFAGYELRFEREAPNSTSTFEDPTTHYLYAGLASEKIGALSFGRQATTADDVLLGDYTYTFGTDNNLTDYADKSIKFISNDMNGLKVGLDYLFGEAEKNDDEGNPVNGFKRGYGVSLFYSIELASEVQLNLAAGYDKQFSNVSLGQKKDQHKTAFQSHWRGAAELDFGQFAFAFNYGESVSSKSYMANEANNNGAMQGYFDDKGAKSKQQHILVGAKYQVIEPSMVYAQWNLSNSKTPTLKGKVQQEESHFIVGADYKLHKNVVTYVEYDRRIQKYKEPNEATKDKDNAFAVGLRAFF